MLNARLGNILYWAGLAGAAISIFYAVDAVWVYESGRSLLLVSGRFVSLQELLTTIGISVVMAFVSWRVGKAARDFINKSPTGRPGAKGRD